MNCRITIINETGEPIFESDTNFQHTTNHMNRDEIKDIFRGNSSGISIRYSSSLNKKFLYIATPQKINGKISLIIRVAAPIETILFFTSQISQKLYILIFIVFFASVTLSWLVLVRYTKEFEAIRSSLIEISKHKFKTRIKHFAKNIFEDLNADFNNMASNLENLFTELSLNKKNFELIFSSVSDGILLLDSKGKIVLHNEAFKILFDLSSQNINRRYYWELVRNRKIDDTFQKIKENKNIFNENTDFADFEFERENKFFLFTLIFAKEDHHFVMTFHDITKAKNFELLKKDFIANASHEIKTPLSLITGFLEMLEDEPLPDSAKSHVSIIQKHVFRLNSLTKNLLLLSSLENTIKDKNKLKFESIDILPMLKETTKLFIPKIQEKKLKFYTNFPEYLPKIQANIFNIEQIIVNLIDNAIKYTEKGAITITCEASKGFLGISITDTGIGIPKEHHTKIFERFYVVDKSRARATGGTGLGLAIVKYLVQLHNGEISLVENENKGTTFVVKFPAIY